MSSESRLLPAFWKGLIVGAAIVGLAVACGNWLWSPATPVSPGDQSAAQTLRKIETELAAQIDRLDSLLQREPPGAAASNPDESTQALAQLHAEIRAQQRQIERLAATAEQLLRHQQQQQQQQQQQDRYQEHLAAGAKLHLAGNFQAAVAQYDQALAINAAGFRVLLNRGMCWQDLQQWDKAMADFGAARDLDPDQYVPWNNIAWLQATCPVDARRDGGQAVENATKACELTEWKNYAVLSTLAAALAEAGDFEAARRRHQEAIDLAPEEVKESLRPPLALYEQEQPLRMAVPAAATPSR